MSEGRGCLEEGCLGLPGVLPDIFRTAIFPRKWRKRWQKPELPDLAWNSQTSFFQTSATFLKWVCEWNGKNIVLGAEVPCEWTFAHSGPHSTFSMEGSFQNATKAPAKILRCWPAMRNVGMYFNIERCEMPAVRTLDALWPAIWALSRGRKVRWQREPKTQIFAESRRFSQIHPFSWKFQHLEGAGNRRKLQIFAGNRRFSQKTAGNRRLGSVTLGPSPLARPYAMRAPAMPNR